MDNLLKIEGNEMFASFSNFKHLQTVELALGVCNDLLQTTHILWHLVVPRS